MSWKINMTIAMVIMVTTAISCNGTDDTQKSEIEKSDSVHALINFESINGTKMNILEKIGVDIPIEIRSLKPNSLFPNGVGDYDSFKKTVLDTIQPEKLVCKKPMMSTSKCMEKRIKGASIILSFSAIGLYRMVLDYHSEDIEEWGITKKVFIEHLEFENPDCSTFFRTDLDDEWLEEECADPEDKCMVYFGSMSDMVLSVSSTTGKYQLHRRVKVLTDLIADWPVRLKLIHKFMSSPSMQDKVVLTMLDDIREENGGDPGKMAIHYYTGKKPSLLRIFNMLVSSMFRQKSTSLGTHYANSIKQCYGKKMVVSNDDLQAFLTCIKKKETGFLEKP